VKGSFIIYHPFWNRIYYRRFSQPVGMQARWATVEQTANKRNIFIDPIPFGRFPSTALLFYLILAVVT
jgi:hypothetical protein